MCLHDSYVEILTSSRVVFGDGAFRRELGLWPYDKKKRNQTSGSLPHEDTGRKWPSEGHKDIRTFFTKKTQQTNQQTNPKHDGISQLPASGTLKEL